MQPPGPHDHAWAGVPQPYPPPWPQPRRSRAGLVVAIVIIVALLALLGATSVVVYSLGPYGSPHADAPPDVCKLFKTTLDGSRLLDRFAAGNGATFPAGEDHPWGDWRLCSFGTVRFPPSDNFQVQVNTYQNGSPVDSERDAKSQFRASGFGCTAAPAAGLYPGPWSESCDGIWKGNVAFAARKGNVIVQTLVSAPTISDPDRQGLRDATAFALNHVHFTQSFLPGT